MLLLWRKRHFPHDPPMDRRRVHWKQRSFLKVPSAIKAVFFFGSVGLPPESWDRSRKPASVRRRTTISGVNSVSFQVHSFWMTSMSVGVSKAGRASLKHVSRGTSAPLIHTHSKLSSNRQPPSLCSNEIMIRSSTSSGRSESGSVLE